MNRLKSRPALVGTTTLAVNRQANHNPRSVIVTGLTLVVLSLGLRMACELTVQSGGFPNSYGETSVRLLSSALLGFGGGKIVAQVILGKMRRRREQDLEDEED